MPKAKMKDPAAVALGLKGGRKGGLARAANMTPAQRSESARKAVQARWTRRSGKNASDYAAPAVVVTDTSEHAFLSLLKRYKATNNPTEMDRLSEQIERMIFHKQHQNVSGSPVHNAKDQNTAT
jgi:hypothetical protein